MTDTVLTAAIEELERLEKAATPERVHADGRFVLLAGRDGPVVLGMVRDAINAESDAAFFAALKNDALPIIRTLRDQLAEKVKECEAAKAANETLGIQIARQAEQSALADRSREAEYKVAQGVWATHQKQFDDLHAKLAAEVERREKAEAWKANVLSALREHPEFVAGQWAGDKEGWGFCFEFISWIRREIADLKRRLGEREWHSIETAPKGGTDIVLWHRLWSRGPSEGYHHEDHWHLADGTAVGIDPTHWMPLPVAPSDTTPESGGSIC